jgi:heme exporter protein C
LAEIRTPIVEIRNKSEIRNSNEKDDEGCMMRTAAATKSLSSALPAVCLLGLMLVVTVAVAVVAPVDVALGPSQRIVYVHVSMAWSSLWLFVLMAASAIQYLRHRDPRWDAWSYAAAELGWLCCSLTLVSGSFWAHEAWGAWWTWDPRLTSSFILWLIYGGALLVRQADTDRHRGAHISAVLAAIGLLDVPLVTMATRWFRSMHPIAPQMEPTMRGVLAVTVGCFTVFFAMLLVRRQRQLRRELAWIAEFPDLETPLAAEDLPRQYTAHKGAA